MIFINLTMNRSFQMLKPICTGALKIIYRFCLTFLKIEYISFWRVLVTSLMMLISTTLCMSHEIKTFNDLNLSCSKYNIISAIKNPSQVFTIQDWRLFTSCEAFLIAYLAVANHNCNFDYFPDNLHKLNTKNISLQQIGVAIEIYGAKMNNSEKELLLDPLWNALALHWPCKKD